MLPEFNCDYPFARSELTESILPDIAMLACITVYPGYRTLSSYERRVPIRP